MKAEVQVRSGALVDAVISGVLLAIFAAAYVVADSWARDARLVPQVVCVLGALSAVVRLAQLSGGLRRHRQDTESSAPLTKTKEAQETDDFEPEVVFARASLADWLRVTAWCAVFFALLFVAGVYVAAAVFSLVYLVFEGGARVWQAVAYAMTAVLLMYLVFAQLLITPLPEGLLRF